MTNEFHANTEHTMLKNILFNSLSEALIIPLRAQHSTQHIYLPHGIATGRRPN